MTTTFIPATSAQLAGSGEAPIDTTPDAVITNDGFFPDVDTAKLRADYRIRDAVTSARLREATLRAMIDAANDLLAWAKARTAEGRTTLADVPAVQLGGESRLVISYRSAIGALTRAYLIEGQRDTDLTGAGQRQVNDLDPSIGELRRDGIYAIRDILGVGRNTIELL